MILVIVSIILSFSLILGGFIMKLTANKPISETVGFRTHEAMINVVNWHYANSKCGILWMLVGAVSFAVNMLLTFAVMPKLNGKTDILLLMILLAVQLIAAVACAVHVERKLKEHKNMKTAG